MAQGKDHKDIGLTPGALPLVAPFDPATNFGGPQSPADEQKTRALVAQILAESEALRARYIARVKDGSIKIKELQWIAIYGDGSYKVADTPEEAVAGRHEDCYSVQHRHDFYVPPMRIGPRANH